MITKLTIENYRCIRHAEMGLGPLTALVGPNGSGKSTVLKALQLEFRGVRDMWQRDPALMVRIEVVGAGLSAIQLYGGSVGNQSRGRWPNSTLHQLSLDALRAINQVAPAGRLDRTGTNFANVFGSLTRKQQEKLSEEFCKLVPTFSDVDVEPSGSPGFHTLRFQDRWKPGVWHLPDDVSDGSLLMLAFLTLQFGDFPDVVCLEEPERGLHPYLMQQLVEFLRGIATGTIGSKRVQFILATHSGDLLDHLRPEEVRFLDRDPKDGAVTVRQVDPTQPKWKEAFAEYSSSLRDAWLSGGLGGVP